MFTCARCNLNTEAHVNPVTVSWYHLGSSYRRMRRIWDLKYFNAPIRKQQYLNKSDDSALTMLDIINKYPLVYSNLSTPVRSN